jgi:hypothetical protein
MYAHICTFNLNLLYTRYLVDQGRTVNWRPECLVRVSSHIDMYFLSLFLPNKRRYWITYKGLNGQDSLVRLYRIPR